MQTHTSLKSTESSKNSNAPFFTSSPKNLEKKSFFKSLGVQPKLTFGAPNDAFEREADRAAEEVVGSINSSSTQIKKNPISTNISPVIQTKIEEEEEKLQMKSESTTTPKQNLSTALQSERSNGTPLSGEIKSQMENAFGSDFSNVRIHTNNASDKLNRGLGSRAFASGNDVFFKSGNYQPNTTSGQKLLAHELTHTIQQKGAENNVNRQIIQGDNIRYRTITWNDFDMVSEGETTHDAHVFASVIPDFNGQLATVNWTPQEDNEYLLTVAYHPDTISLHAEMDTDQSWKSAWLTDDDAAHAKLGADADIELARATLLAHEQLHFTNAKTTAELYIPLVRAAVPTTSYTETVTASSREELVTKARTLLERKNEEVRVATQVVIDQAIADLSKVQGLYDTDTNHSQIVDEQTRWREHYAEAYEEARTRDLSAPGEEPEHAHEEAETTP